MRGLWLLPLFFAWGKARARHGFVGFRRRGFRIRTAALAEPNAAAHQLDVIPPARTADPRPRVVDVDGASGRASRRIRMNRAAAACVRAQSRSSPIPEEGKDAGAAGDRAPSSPARHVGSRGRRAQTLRVHGPVSSPSLPLRNRRGKQHGAATVE
jgi:hypothetical protein